MNWRKPFAWLRVSRIRDKMNRERRSYKNSFNWKVPSFACAIDVQKKSILPTADEIQSEIQHEKAVSAELDEKLRDYEKKLRRKQIELGGAHVADSFNANVRKQERILENRLDTVGEWSWRTVAYSCILDTQTIQCHARIEQRLARRDRYSSQRERTLRGPV